MNILSQNQPVNWIDGMKLNKDIFIAQDNAHLSRMYQLASVNLSEHRYGLLPAPDNFEIHVAVDNQQVAFIQLFKCRALTRGGVLIDISQETGELNSLSLKAPLHSGITDTVYWIFITAQPFERVPFGEISPLELPPRLPFVKFKNELAIVQDNELEQMLANPLAMPVAKIYVNGNIIRNDEDYIPPCIATNAHHDLIGLQAELDIFLSSVESDCSQIVQKIYKKSQQNELSDLAKFVCDRMILFMAQAITDFRLSISGEPPLAMLSTIIKVARVLKNSVDLRTGSGKDELMNYLCEWCNLKQGELEQLLADISVLKYKHYDINENISSVIYFAKIIGKLFSTLRGLEFIGKKKESGLFVKEELNHTTNDNQPKPKRRFFG